MTMPQERTKTGPLHVLGISDEEQDVYRWLLSRPGLTLSEIAAGLSLTVQKVRCLIDSIGSKGLITQSPERPRRYIALAPDIALKALSFRRHEELQRAEAFISELQAVAEAKRQANPERMVELITNREAERQILGQMHSAAVEEIVALVRLPMLITHPSRSEPHKLQKEAQIRGVRYRSINDSGFLNAPGMLGILRRDMENGEEARFYPTLPFKMLMADRRVALVPLDPHQPGSPVLLLRASALLDALYVLFEVLWERSLPLSFSRDDLKIGTSDCSIPEMSDELITLMAAGLNDKKISAELGISQSTLKRRIKEAMQLFNVRTRFQLGRATGEPQGKKRSRG